MRAWVLVILVTAFGAAGLPAQEPADREQARSRVLRASPAGDTVALVTTRARVEPMSRSGDWFRVRLEGWIHVEELAASGTTVTTPSLAAIRADPEGHRGATVRWSVQSLGVQRADAVRSDMPLGQPFLLVRDPGGEAGLVYVLLEPDHLAVVGNLTPLQRIEVVARVRLGSSPLTGHPIVELIELRAP